ncbi:dna polymerase family b protein, partial [Cystoisospora suis]
PFPPRPHHYSHSHPPPTSSPSLPRPPSSPSLRRPPSSPSLPHPPSSSSLPRPPSSSSPLLPHPPHSHPPSSSSPSSLSFAFSTYSPGEPHNVSSSRLLHRPSIPRSLSLPSSTLSLSSSPPPCPFFTASPPSVSSSTRPPPTSSNTGTSAPVLSVSITVIEPCLDSPISPLDPLLSPFSRRRIWKLPSIRIYGVINENPQAFLTFETSSSSSSSSLPSHPRPFIPWSPNSPSSLPNFISSSSSFSSRSYLSTSSFSPSSSFSSFSSSSSSSSPVRLPEADRRFVGKTCCLVVHNVFPYFFVPVPHEAYGRIDAWLDWFSEKLKTCEEAIMQKPRPLEKNTKRGRPTPSSKPNHASSFSPSSSSSRWHPFQGPQTSSLRQTPPSSSFPPCPPLIFSLRLVKRYSFYGYDHSPRLFVQIFTLFPGSRTTELAARLLQGRVTGSPLQPFEIHIPYLIHFLADFRLRGMDLLTIQKPHFANPPILKPLHLLHAFPSSSSFLLLREYAHLRSSGRPNSHDDGSIRNEELSSTGFKSSVSLRSCPTAGRGDRRRDETLCLYDFLLEVEKQEKEEREMLVIEGKTSLPPGRRGCPMKSVGGGGGVLLSHAWRSLWLRLRREKMRGLTDVRRENDTCSYGVNSLEKKTQGDNSEKEDKQEEDEEECYASSHKEEEVDLSRQVRSSMLDARSSLSKECSRFSLRYPNNYEAEREKKNGEGGRDEEVHLFRYDREHGDTTTSTRMIRGGGHDISTLNDATSQVKVDQRTTSPSYFPAATSSSSLLPLSSSSSSFVSSSLSMSSFKSPSPPGASVTASSHLPLQGQQIQGEKRKERERSISSSSSSSSSCIEPRLVLQRRTKCEVEVHANAVNILNPFFLFSEKDENEKTTAWKGEECGGDTDSPFPSRSNGVCADEISCSCEPTRLSDRRELISPPSSSSSKKTTVKFPIGEDRLLLHSVLDFWREEARRCSMFGIDFPFASRSSVPPPSTLPPDAVAALAKRNEVPARHAVPEIFKRQFLQLLRRTGLLLGDGLDPLSLPGMKEFQREGERNGRLAQGVVPMRSSGERKRGEGGQEKEMTQGEGREGLHANSVFLDASHENLLRREQETNRPRRESLGIEDTDSGRRRRRQEGVNERERFGEFDEEDYGEKERTEEEEQKKKKPLRHFTQESLASSFSSPSSAGGSQASSLRLSQDMNEEEPPVSWHLSSSQDEEHQECFSSSLNFPSSSYSSIPSSGVSKEISSIASSSSPHSSPAISVENSLLPCQGTLGLSSCTWGSAGSMASSHVYTNRQVVSGCLSTQLIHQPENKASERKSVNALGPSVRLPSREDISEEQIGEETAEAKDLGSRPFSSSSSSSMIPGQVAIDHSRMQKSDLQERKKETSSENEMGYMSRETSSSLLCPSGSKQISSPSHLFHHPHDTIDEEELLHLSLPPSQQAPVDSSFIRRPSPVSSCIQALSQGEACKKKEMNSPNEAIEKEDGSNTLPTQGEREDVYFSSSSLHERSEAEEEVDGEMRKEEIKPLLSLVSSPSRLRTTDLEEGGTTKQDREEDEMTKRENRDRKSIHRQRMKEAEEEEEKELSSLHLDSHERAGITSSFSGELTGREELQSRSADKRKTDRETTNPRYEEEEEEEEEKEREEEEEEEEEEYLERDVDLSSRRVSSESSSDTKMREGDTTCIEIFRHHGGIPTSRTQSSSAGEDTEEEEERERLERERRLTRLERDSHMTRRRGRGRARRKKRKSRRAAFLDSSSSSSSSSDYSTPDTLSPPTAGYDRTEEASSGDELSDGSSPKRHPGIVLRTKDHLDKDHPSISRDDKNLVDIHMHLHERENLPGSSPCSFQADKRDLSDTEERDFDGGGGKGPENEERVESRRKERGRSEVDTRKTDKERESERKKRHRHLKEEVEASWLRDPSEDNKKLLTEEEITDGGITGEVERKEGKGEKKEHRRRRGEVAGNEEDQGASSSSSSSSSLSDATVVLSSQDHQDNQKDTKTDRMKEEEVDEKKEEEKREEEKRGEEEEESAHEKRSREGTSAESSGRALPCSSGETGVEVADSTAEERKTIREEDSSHGFYSDGKAPSQEREREGRKTLDSELAWRSHQASDTSKVPRSEALSSMIRISAVKMKEEEEEKKKNISRQREREMLYQTRTENEEKRIGEERSFQGEMRDAISKERLKASTGGLSEGARGTQKEKEENYEKGHQRCLHLETSDFLKKDGQKTTEEESSELKRSDEKTDHSFSSSSSLLPLPLSPSRITPNQPPSRTSCDPSSSSLSLPPLSTAASRQLLQLGELSPSYSRSSGDLVSSPSSSSSSSLLPLSQLEKREWVSEWTEEPPVLPFFGDPRDVPVLLLASSAPLSSSLSSASALETVTLGGRERLARSIRAQREGVTEDEQRRGMRATVLDLAKEGALEEKMTEKQKTFLQDGYFQEGRKEREDDRHAGGVGNDGCLHQDRHEGKEHSYSQASFSLVEGSQRCLSQSRRGAQEGKKREEEEEEEEVQLLLMERREALSQMMKRRRDKRRRRRKALRASQLSSEKIFSQSQGLGTQASDRSLMPSQQVGKEKLKEREDSTWREEKRKTFSEERKEEERSEGEERQTRRRRERISDVSGEEEDEDNRNKDMNDVRRRRGTKGERRSAQESCERVAMEKETSSQIASHGRLLQGMHEKDSPSIIEVISADSSSFPEDERSLEKEASRHSKETNNPMKPSPVSSSSSFSSSSHSPSKEESSCLPLCSSSSSLGGLPGRHGEREVGEKPHCLRAIDRKSRHGQSRHTNSGPPADESPALVVSLSSSLDSSLISDNPTSSQRSEMEEIPPFAWLEFYRHPPSVEEAISGCPLKVQRRVERDLRHREQLERRKRKRDKRHLMGQSEKASPRSSDKRRKKEMKEEKLQLRREGEGEEAARQEYDEKKEKRRKDEEKREEEIDEGGGKNKNEREREEDPCNEREEEVAEIGEKQRRPWFEKDEEISERREDMKERGKKRFRYKDKKKKKKREGVSLKWSTRMDNVGRIIPMLVPQSQHSPQLRSEKERRRRRKGKRSRFPTKGDKREEERKCERHDEEEEEEKKNKRRRRSRTPLRGNCASRDSFLPSSKKEQMTKEDPVQESSSSSSSSSCYHITARKREEELVVHAAQQDAPTSNDRGRSTCPPPLPSLLLPREEVSSSSSSDSSTAKTREAPSRMIDPSMEKSSEVSQPSPIVPLSSCVLSPSTYTESRPLSHPLGETPLRPLPGEQHDQQEEEEEGEKPKDRQRVIEESYSPSYSVGDVEGGKTLSSSSLSSDTLSSSTHSSLTTSQGNSLSQLSLAGEVKEALRQAGPFAVEEGKGGGKGPTSSSSSSSKGKEGEETGQQDREKKMKGQRQGALAGALEMEPGLLASYGALIAVEILTERSLCSVEAIDAGVADPLHDGILAMVLLVRDERLVFACKQAKQEREKRRQKKREVVHAEKEKKGKNERAGEDRGKSQGTMTGEQEEVVDGKKKKKKKKLSEEVSMETFCKEGVADHHGRKRQSDGERRTRIDDKDREIKEKHEGMTGGSEEDEEDASDTQPWKSEKDGKDEEEQEEEDGHDESSLPPGFEKVEKKSKEETQFFKWCSPPSKEEEEENLRYFDCPIILFVDQAYKPRITLQETTSHSSSTSSSSFPGSTTPTTPTTTTRPSPSFSPSSLPSHPFSSTTPLQTSSTGPLFSPSSSFLSTNPSLSSSSSPISPSLGPPPRPSLSSAPIRSLHSSSASSTQPSKSPPFFSCSPVVSSVSTPSISQRSRQTDLPPVSSFHDFVSLWRSRHGFTKLSCQEQLKAFLPDQAEVISVESESDLLDCFSLVCGVVDPSIILHWESHTGIGYILRRARVLGCSHRLISGLSRRLDRHLLSSLSSALSSNSPLPNSSFASPLHKPRPSFSSTPSSSSSSSSSDETTSRHVSRETAKTASRPFLSEGPRRGGMFEVFSEGSSLSGRLLLECWRVLQHEVKLQQSSLEGVAKEILNVTFASVPHAVLANLWKQGQAAQRRTEIRDEAKLMTGWRLWQYRLKIDKSLEMAKERTKRKKVSNRDNGYPVGEKDCHLVEKGSGCHEGEEGEKKKREGKDTGGEEDEEKKRKKNGEGEDRGEEEEEEKKKKKRLGNDKDREDRDVEGRSLDEEMNKERRKKKEEKKEDAVGVVEDGGGCHQENRSLYPIVEEEKESLERPESSMTLEESYSSDKDLSEILGTTERSERSDFNTGSTEGEGTPPLHLSMKKMEDRKEVIAEQTRKITEEEEKNVKKLSREGKRLSIEGVEEGENEEKEQEEEEGEQERMMYRMRLWNLFEEVERTVEKTSLSAAETAIEKEGGAGEKESKEDEGGDVDGLWGIRTMGSVLKYLLGRVCMMVSLIDSTELIPRTSELARLYGCDFISALSRGSQFKVESVMIRATKRLNFLFVSPSQTQVTEQPANLCIPLVLEPKSGFYWSPVCVLDFQSLYPSIIIANNICYATALGSVEIDPIDQPMKTLGVMSIHVPPQVFRQISQAYRRKLQHTLPTQTPPTTTTAAASTSHSSLQAFTSSCIKEEEEEALLFSADRDHLAMKKKKMDGLSNDSNPSQLKTCLPPQASHGSLTQDSFRTSQDWSEDKSGIRVLPNGSMFVSRRVRRGIFPQVLSDILQTRIMVKQAMKKYKGKVDENLLRLLNYRQYGLKMIANVSYGYTAASFTGHMPCADIADAIVQTARTTLMRAIALVHSTPRWGGRVLYGDTDSLFVLLENKSLEAAFEIGREIAYTVTQQNPSPVELQLEKVFYPCCLVSKKRYVGNAYTSPTSPPFFDAKGIEAIRRDQCGCTSSLLESSLRIFFSTRDLSQVKSHLYRQWMKILSNRISLKEFIFYRKCRLGSYKAEFGASTAASLPAQAKVAYARMQALAQSAAVTRGSDDRESESLLLARRSGPARGERVAFVYADLGLGGNQAFLSGTKKTSLRLLDCAVSPDQVEGGGRPDDLVRIFLYGIPCMVLRPMPLQVIAEPFDCLVPREGNRGLGGEQESFGGDMTSGGGWFRRWIDKGSSRCMAVNNAYGRPASFFTTRGSSRPGMPLAGGMFEEPHRSEGLDRMRGARRTDLFSRGFFLSSSPFSNARGEEWVSPSPWQGIGGYRLKNHLALDSLHSKPALLPVYLKYYIVKQVIPAMDRLFGLLPFPTCVDLKQWYENMPKPRNTTAAWLKYYVGTDQRGSNKPAAPPAGGASRQGSGLDRWGISPSSPQRQRGGVSGTIATRHTLARHGPPSKRSSLMVQKLPAAPSPSRPLIRETEQARSSLSAAQKQQQKLLQALKIDKKSSSRGGGSGTRLHHFFATSSCILCGEKCSLLPPKALDDALLRTTSPGGGRLGPRGGRGRRRERQIEFEEEETGEDIRAMLFRKLENGSFNARKTTQKERKDIGEPVVIDLASSASSSITQAASLHLAGLGGAGTKAVLGRRGEDSQPRQPPPVCSACSANAEGIIVQMYRQLEEVERRMNEIENICETCAGSKLCAAACLNAWHCDVYFLRLRNEHRYATVTSQMRALHLHVKRGR